MVVRVHGGAQYDQNLTGNLRHYRILGIDFSGAISDGNVIIPNINYGLDSHGHQIVHVVPEGTPVPGSAAEIIFLMLGEQAQVAIMNPSSDGLFFALENDSNSWDISDMQFAIRNLGTDVGVDHLDLHLANIEEVPYELSYDLLEDPTFLILTDTPDSYVGQANKAVLVKSDESGLEFISLGSAGPIALTDLTDVTITSVANNNVLQFNGTQWVNISPPWLTSISGLSINDLLDVNTAGVSNGQTLIWNGTTFVPGTVSGSTSIYLVPTPGSTLVKDSKYFLGTNGSSYILPNIATLVPGDYVDIASSITATSTISGFSGQQIATTIGTDSVIFVDVASQMTFLFDGTRWELIIT